MQQRIIHAYPPNFPQIARAFPWVKGHQGILYSYGDRIYNPSGVKVDPWLKAHEAVHGERQEDTGAAAAAVIDRWWDDYIADPVFRLTEEVLAHQAEWRAYTGRTPELYLEAMARRLSGPLYGGLMTKTKAQELITQ